MAFDISPENLADEVRHAEEVREDYLGLDYEDKIARYAGPGYRSYWRGRDVDFENHAYQWISLFLPLLASGNPRIKARSPRVGYAQQLVKAVEMAVNRNFALQNVKAVIEKLAVDFAFKYAVAITLPAKRPGMSEAEDPPHRPVTKRISPTRFIWDHQALEHTDVRFQGHLLRRDKDDMLDEAQKHPKRGWNVDLINRLSEDRQSKEETRKRDHTVKRGQVEYYELYIPEHRLKEGFDAKGKSFAPQESKGYHGTIVTVPASYNSIEGPTLKPQHLREPRPFFGPRGGPYTFGGYLIVPDEVIPLGPLAATEAQAQELNNMRMAISAALETFKIGIAVDSMAGQELAQKMKEFEDLGVFVLDNVDKLSDHLAKIQMGGPDPLHFQSLAFLRDSLDRSSGMTEAQRGEVTGEATATEASIARMGSGQRMGYMTEKFIVGMAKPIAEKEAWYLARDPRSHIDLGPDSAGRFRDEEGEIMDYPVEFQGSSKNLSHLEEAEIDIEAISMRYTSEALEAQREMAVDMLIQTEAPLIPQMPYIDWETRFAWKGDQIGNPELPRLFNIPKAMKLGEMMMGAQLTGGPSGGNVHPKPRLGIDLPTSGPKASEKPTGFSGNARPQVQKGPRNRGETSSTKEAIKPIGK